MGLLKLCQKEDPVLKLLALHGAIPLRVPEERVKPLFVIAVSRQGKHHPLGMLSPLLKGNGFDLADLPMGSSATADVHGVESSEVAIGLGLDILRGYLSGFGLPNLGFEGAFDGVTHVLFYFRNVRRIHLDTCLLGNLLKGRALDPDNPTGRVFLDSYEMNVVNSVMTTSEFVVRVERTTMDDFAFTAPMVEELFGEAAARARVERSDQRQLSFSGPQQLTFAYTACRFHVASDGRILTVAPGEEYLGVERALGPTKMISPPKRVVIGDEPAMLSWDEMVDTWP